ncbi:MAG: hypothetical protein AB7F35_20320 [Acetobacteraceae bacterium]
MTRWFYDDPLAAKIMMRDFGMRFQIHLSYLGEDYGMLDVETLYDLDETWSQFIYIEATSPEHDDFAFGHDEPKRLFIHPESVSLLVPQVGDLVQFQYPSWPHSCAGYVVITNKSGVVVATGPQSQESYPLDFNRCAIIQRNGLVFHWPQQEQA